MNALRNLRVSQSISNPTNNPEEPLHHCKRISAETILNLKIIVVDIGQARDVNEIGVAKNNILSVLHAFLYTCRADLWETLFFLSFSYLK
tara:strand:+ start:1428 stop:1697 length:270 start_codon:yes stop_codon:yes gene_type:complete